MSWLSQGLSDVGLGGANTFFNSAIKPALENPVVDVGLGLGAAALTGGLLAPEIAGAFGAGASADAAGGAALGYAGDVGAGASTTGSGLFDFAAPIATDPLATTDLSAGLPGVNSAGGVAGSTGAGGVDPLAGALQANAGGVPTPTTYGEPDVWHFPTTSVAAGGGSQPGPIATGLSDMLGGAVSAPTLSTIGAFGAPALGVAGLGYNLYQGYQQKQQLNALQQQENTLSANQQQQAAATQAAAAPELQYGEQLQQYLTTGTLPQGSQAQVDQWYKAAVAAATQGYASRGMSPDPNQNSALAQDIANLGQQKIALTQNLEQQLNTAGTQMVQTANNLIATGSSSTQISAQIPIAMQNLNLQLAQATGTAISNFAAALGGGGLGGKGQTITLQQAPATV